MNPRHIAPLLSMLILLLALAAAGLPADAASGDDVLPPTLAATGLFADAHSQALQADVVAFSPQYPLWSDGADKHRWLRLPPGTTIDARDPDAWVFPVGTQLWKSFLHDGRAVETRYIERRADGRWRYAVYLWNAQGTQAALAPARGAVLAVPQAPGGRYDVPGRADCLACHDSAAVPVLGFTALQLSADRDPLAPHADPGGPVDLRSLVARGLLRGLRIGGRQLLNPQRNRLFSGRKKVFWIRCHTNGSDSDSRIVRRKTQHCDILEPLTQPRQSSQALRAGFRGTT